MSDFNANRLAQIELHLTTPVHAKLVAAGWAYVNDFAVCYQKDNAEGYLLISAADWEGAEFDFESVYVSQQAEDGELVRVLSTGCPLDHALAMWG